MTTKAAYRKMKRCCIYKLEFPAPGDRVGSDSSDINALYLHVQPALLEIQLSACVPSFPNKDFLMEIFSPNPSKNCKSPKPWSRMQLNAGPCREAAAEGTHGLLPLCSKAPPQEEPPSLSSALSHISENFLISRAQPKAQQADWVNVFPGSEHCCCSAQNHTLIRPEVLSDTQNESRIPEWVGKDPTAPLFWTPSTIPGIPVQLKLGHFQGWSIPKACLGVQSFFSCTRIVIPAFKQDIIMKRLCS